jgi:hypothetical protein
MLWGSRFTRALLVVFLLVLVLPQPAYARPNPAVVVNFDVIFVKRDVSVTIRTRDFPQRTKFTVQMDLAGKKSKDPAVVGEFNSDKGGVIEQTFTIPDDLKGKILLALYIKSADGYEAYNWFFNDNQVNTLPDPKARPAIDFSEAKKGVSVNVEAKNLPTNTAFWVRVGPYEGFYSKYTFMHLVTSSADGTVKFSVPLPANVQKTEYIMVRLDGGGTYAYNIYQNIDGGKAVPEAQVNKVVECQVINLNIIPALKPREDFDVIWTVQNTGLSDWEMQHVLFKFIGGEPMHKYKDTQTLPATIKRGEVHEFVLDMRAPEKPGWYKATWMVEQVMNTQKNLCRLSVTVIVQ